MREDLDRFVCAQLSQWPLAKDNFDAVKSVKIKEMEVNGLKIKAQFNPSRIISSVAKTDKASLEKRACFLCPEHRFPEQFCIPFEGRYDILLNPYPIFPDHLVIAASSHTEQSIWGRYEDILAMAETFPGYTFFYNGPKCGASAPDHHHFQACGNSLMPLEADVDVSVNDDYLLSQDDAQIYHYKKFARGIFVIKSRSKESSVKLFYRLMKAAPLQEGDTEPRFNLIVSFKDGELRAIVIFRKCHRSHHFYSEGEDHLTMSPGCADMGGVFIVPKEDEFEKINSRLLSDMLDEITITKDEEDAIATKLKYPQPKVSVGIMSAETLEFEIVGEGRKKAVFKDGKIAFEGKLFEELYFDVPSHFILYDVTIGKNFHWERKEEEKFAGDLKIIVEGDKLTAVNIIGVEDYLLSVISSEMKASASLEFLKAHAVISRSWLMAILKRENSSAPLQRSDENEIIRWYGRDDHSNYDVCADDHCQRYQGLARAVGDNVKKAIEATWGQVLMYDGKICDARFSKCCGGSSELFSSCWEDKDYPYLKALPDTPGHIPGDAFCDTSDKEILSQVLNDYDIETEDFYKWRVEYDATELSSLIKEKSGRDIGELLNLEPLQRGPSGRLTRLGVIGSKASFVVGKELEIRRILSESHLRSSAFEVIKSGNKFILDGRGWGHGVGLCQIGAAVMASKGYDYLQILQHYYPDATVKQR